MQNIIQKRSVGKTIERIDEYLQNKGFVALNQIALDLHLQFSSVKKYIETLHKLNRVEIATNDKTTLIKSKVNGEKTTLEEIKKGIENIEKEIKPYFQEVSEEEYQKYKDYNIMKIKE